MLKSSYLENNSPLRWYDQTMGGLPPHPLAPHSVGANLRCKQYSCQANNSRWANSNQANDGSPPSECHSPCISHTTSILTVNASVLRKVISGTRGASSLNCYSKHRFTPLRKRGFVPAYERVLMICLLFSHQETPPALLMNLAATRRWNVIARFVHNAKGVTWWENGKRVISRFYRDARFCVSTRFVRNAESVIRWENDK